VEVHDDGRVRSFMITTNYYATTSTRLGNALE
jgi:hypothetical protein